MSSAIPIEKNIYWVGVDDWETARFENIWPLPTGISYNSYLIIDRKTVLIDTIKRSFLPNYMETIKSLLPTGQKLDYLIINHIEPDHSGAVTSLLEHYPEMQILGNKKTAGFLEHFYSIRENVRIIEEGEILEIGDRKLKFLFTPMVHWPETMVTYELSGKLLFTGDIFGSFGALNGAIFDDEIFDIAAYEDEILRYFSNVIGRYSQMAQNALTKLSELDVSIIASTHGPVWRKKPRHVWSLYDRWSKHETDPGAVIAYTSMYGNTESMMEAVGRGLSEEGLETVKVHNVAKSHASYIIRDIWRYKALILGTPTYNMKPMPQIDDLVRLLENKMMENRLLGLFGSYGWSGGGVKALTEFASRDKGWALIEPIVEAHCAPTENDLAGCKQLGKNLAQRIRNSKD